MGNITTGDGTVTKPVKKTVADEYWFPIAIMTGFYGVIFIIGFFLWIPSKRILRACIMMTAVVLWLFWLIVYMSQINPLFGPRLANTTLIWIGETWGDKLWG
ncbi:ATP synthase subunit H domain-containing protein [Phthorimaea operculella]|nr:ATP synthase subunit H domain-containing protein [Phthorimaea operculella]